MGNGSSSSPYEGVFKVADFLDVPQCAELLVLSKSVPVKCDTGSRRASWYRYLCARFKEEYDLFVPGPFDSEKPAFGEWPSFTRKFYNMRKGMVGGPDMSLPSFMREEEVEDTEFNIGVMCRLTSRKTASPEEPEREVVLPLHQKVSLVREKYPDLSSNDALKAIVAERGTPALADVFIDSDVKSVSLQDAKRATPAPCDKKTVNQASILSTTETSILAVANGIGLQTFDMDRVFEDMTTQEEVYSGHTRDVVYDFVNGMNGCIICYGQTGSGKTYTMFGPSELDLQDETSEYRGIAPRAFQDIFTARGGKPNSTISVSYVEVYGTAISDLLNEGKIVGQEREGRYANTRATDRVGHRYVLDGNLAKPVTSMEDVVALLKQADEYKRQAATAMNDRSTRAHTLLLAHLTTITKTGVKVTSKLFLVDLGGSERITKSKAGEAVKSLVTVIGDEETQRIKFAEYYESRQRIQETMYINQGLFTLKKVIKALLIKRDEHRGDMRIPYFDNKLTMLLAPCLGKSTSRTVVMCCLSLDPDSAYESLQTLRFAEACRNIVTKHKGNDSHVLRLAIEKIDVEIAELEEVIKQKETWKEVREERVDVDTRGGAFGEDEEKFEVKEVVVKSVLVGAEKERTQLETLLLRRRTMLGLDSLGKEFREKMEQQADGGKGSDFRESSFSKKLKAKDFEDLVVVADSLRFLFRKTSVAKELCGETEETMCKRLKRENIPEQYHKWAATLREQYENTEGQTQTFGKVMMDQCLAWSKTQDREEAVNALVKIVSTSVNEETELVS